MKAEQSKFNWVLIVKSPALDMRTHTRFTMHTDDPPPEPGDTVIYRWSHWDGTRSRHGHATIVILPSDGTMVLDARDACVWFRELHGSLTNIIEDTK